MLQQQGYATIIDPNSPIAVQEFDTITCPHCGSVSMTKTQGFNKYQVLVFKADGTHYMRDAGFCRSCYQPVCPKCDGKPCDNRFRRLEEEEKKQKIII